MAQVFNLTAQLNLQGPNNIGRIVSDIKKQLGTIEGEVKFKVDASTVKNIAQLNSSLQSFNTTLSNTTSIANNAAKALADLRSSIGGISIKNVASDIKSAASATDTLAAASKKASKDIQSSRTELEEFGRQSALAIRRFTAFTVVSGIMFKVSNAINQGLIAAIDFERQMVKLEQITGKSQQGLSSLSDTITNLSSGLGVSSASLISIADTLAQAGLNAKDTEIALKALALTDLAPSFDSLNETVEGSIALMRQFEISAGELQGALGSINSVAARFAVESSDLITAIQRTGGVFATASKGVSEGTDALNEFLAVFTSVRATTRESAETIATGLRTIFTRIQREDTIDALSAYGVQLTDVEGKFIGAYRAVEQLSRGLSKLDPRSVEFSSIVEELGGFRQIGKVIPLIQQFSVAQEALKVAQTGQDSLAYDAVTAQKSLANQIVKVREEFLALIRGIGQSDIFQSLAKGALSFASTLISITDTIKGVLPILAIIGIQKGISATAQFGKGFIGGLRKVSNKDEDQGSVAGNVGKTVGETLSGARSERASRASNEIVSSLNAATSSISDLANTINANINALQSNTNSLMSNTASIDALTLAINTRSSPGTLNSGGRVLGFASGGSVPGAGNTDSVPAMLTPGEFVVNKKAARAVGSKNLHRINGYAKGGIAKAVVEEVVDGDTINIDIVPTTDLFNTSDTRLFGYDAYETRSGTKEERELGKKAKNEAKIVYPKGRDVTGLFTDSSIAGSKEKYGRYFYKDNNFGQNLIAKGLAIPYLGTGERATKKSIGGLIQKFAEGGVAQRKIGYIDYDVIANEANKAIVEKGMKETGSDGPRIYSDYLTKLAVNARKSSSIQKLRAIYGVAGSGKTTLARGQGTDNAKLRQTERFPILSPEDIQKATEILILTSSVSKTKMDDFLGDVDRAYTLSSTTSAERSRVKDQRGSRDVTGIGLEGRQPGTTMGVSTDTAVGEALLSDKLGDRSTVLGRSSSGRLRRKSGNELVEIIKKRIGFTWGGFAPTTAGHESIMDAAAAMGIPPEDFIALVGANEAVDASSYRTAIFDQDARVLLAKAGFGAKGATVLPKPRDFEVPQGFDITQQGSDRRQVLIPGKGSTAFVADKTEDQTAKYKQAGYDVKSIERTGGISGTMVRDLIIAGDMAKLQSVLSPGVYDLVSNNIGRIQNRANVLPSLIAQAQKEAQAEMSQVDQAIEALGIKRIDSEQVASDPEYAAKVEVLKELRSKKQKIKSAAGFTPYKLLDALAQKDPQNYALDFSTPATMGNVPAMRVMGQNSQTTEAPMPVGRVAQLAQEKNKSISDIIIEQLGGLGGPAGVKRILGIGSGDRTLSSLLQAGNIKSGKGLEQAADYVNKALAARGIRDAAEAKRLEEYQAKAMHFGIAGLLPMDYSKEFEWNVGGTDIYAIARGFGSMYLEEARQMQGESAALAQKFAENIQNKNIFGGGEKLAFDFDKTLIEDADILDAKGNPDIPQYSNRDAVQKALKNARPTRLAVKLKSLIDQDPSFIKQTRILTARPQSTADLLAQSLQSFGLPYSEADITGVSGLGNNIPALKAANLQQEEKLIDDSLDNIRAAQKAGKKGFQYVEPKSTTSELDEKMGQGNIEGAIVEKALAVLGAPIRPDAKQNRAIDYPDGLGSAAQFFPGIDPGIPTEVKRTIDGTSLEKVREEIGRYITGGAEAVKLAGGGKVDYYSLEKNSGFGSREFDTLVQFAKTSDFSLDEFQAYLKQRLSYKSQNAQLRMDPASLLRAVTPEPARATKKQLELAEQLKGEPDAGYRPILTEAQRIAANRSAIRSSALEDINNATRFAAGGVSRPPLPSPPKKPDPNAQVKAIYQDKEMDAIKKKWPIGTKIAGGEWKLPGHKSVGVGQFAGDHKELTDFGGSGWKMRVDPKTDNDNILIADWFLKNKSLFSGYKIATNTDKPVWSAYVSRGTGPEIQKAAQKAQSDLGQFITLNQAYDTTDTMIPGTGISGRFEIRGDERSGTPRANEIVDTINERRKATTKYKNFYLLYKQSPGFQKGFPSSTSGQGGVPGTHYFQWLMQTKKDAVRGKSLERAKELQAAQDEEIKLIESVLKEKTPEYSFNSQQLPSPKTRLAPPPPPAPPRRFAGGGKIKLYHGSNTGVNDNVLNSFKEKGALPDIAQGYGQGAGFYVYSGKEKAKEQAMMRVKGGLGSFTVVSGDTAGKPMVLTFEEALDPVTWDLDYELNKGSVVKWLAENYDKIKDKVAPGEKLTGIKDIVNADSSKGIMSQGIKIQSDTGSRKTIYSGTDSNLREGELLGQIMSRLQASDPKMVGDFENTFFKSPSLASGEWDNLALKYVGASPLKPTNIETFARGGFANFADGGHVQALLTPGEAVIGPKLAKKIGYNQLNKMNHAEKNGIGKYANGGDVSIVPGSGNSDTFGPVPLPVGSFVIRKKATKALGFNKGGSIGKPIRFMAGGPTPPVPTPDPADVKPIVTASKQAAGDIKAAMDYVRDQIISAAKKAGVETYRSTRDLGGTIKDALDAARAAALTAAKDKNKEIYSNRDKILEPFKINPNDIYQNGRFSGKITKPDIAITPKDLKAGAPEASPVAQFLNKDTSQIKAESLAREKEAAEKRALADQAASRNSTAVSFAMGLLGGVIQKVAKQFGDLGGVIGNVIANAGTRTGTARESIKRLQKKETVEGLNFVGQKTGINQLLAKVGFGPLGNSVGLVTKALGGYATAIYVSLGAIKDFYNGMLEAEKKLTENKIAQSTNRLTFLFDKMAKGIDADGSLSAINGELNSLASSLNRQVELNRKAEFMWVGILDWMGQSGAMGEDVANRANQRGDILKNQGTLAYLQSGLSDLVGGTAREDLYQDLIPKVVQQRAEAGRQFVEPYAKSTEARLRKGENTNEIMKDLGSRFAPSDKAKQLATQDIDTQAQIERIRLGSGTKEQKENKISVLEYQTASALLGAQLKSQEAAIIAERLNKITNEFVTSITRLMSSMDQSISKSTFELQQLANTAKLSRDSLGGKASSGSVNLEAINILRNPKAYNDEQRTGAARMGAAAFGIDAKLTEGLIGLPNNLEESMSRAINSTIAEGRASGERKISARVEKAAIDVIRQMDFGSGVEDLLIKQTRGAFDKARSKEDDTISYKELAEEIPALTKQIDAANRAQESAIRALELWQSVLNSYSEAMNRQVQDQIDINNYLRKASDIRTKGEIALSDALNKEVSLRTRINSTLSGVQSMTGGEINPASISSNVLDLENTRRAEQQAVDALANGAIGATNDFQLMSQKLASTNLALRENYAALENLATSSDIAAAALSQVQEISNKIKAGETFIEKLVTSSPGEINKLNRSFSLLSNNMQGMANSGTTAEERSQSLQLFNMLAPLLGNGKQQNELKGNVLQSMLQESGIALDSNLSSLIEGIKNPESLTEMQEAIGIYRSGVDLQAAANLELANIKQVLKENDLKSSNQQLITGFENVMKGYQENQLNAIALNTRETADALKNGVPAPTKSSGGIIYASKGQAIFKPKGSDTVPAMLTPGEFVVNKSATSKNLPLLQSINNGYSKGGSVSYYADGGPVAAFGKAVSSDDSIWKPEKLRKMTEETRVTPDSEKLSDKKYPTKEYLDKVSTPESFISYKANRVFFAPDSDKVVVNSSEIYEDINKVNGFVSSKPMSFVSRQLNALTIPYVGDSYDSIEYRDGTTTYKGYNPLSTEAFNAFPQLIGTPTESDTEKKSKSEQREYKNLLINKRREIDTKLKPLLEAYNKKQFVLNSSDAMNNSIMNFPKADIKAKTIPGIGGLGSYDINGLSAPMSSDKLLGFFSATPDDAAVRNIGLGTSKRGLLTLGMDNIVSGSLRNNYPNKGTIFGSDYPLNWVNNRKNIFEANTEFGSNIDTIIKRFKDEKFSSETRKVASRKNIIRKLMALYNNSTNYIDLSEDEFSEIEVDKLNDVRTAAALSEDPIFPIRFYSSDASIPLRKDIDIQEAISGAYGEDFASYIYGDNKLKTKQLQLANVSGDVGSIKRFSAWIPSGLVDKIISGTYKSKLGPKISPISVNTKPYKGRDSDILSFNYNEIDPNSLTYNETARRFDEKIKLSDKFGTSLVDGKLLTINSTSGNNNPFNGMLESNQQLIIKDSIDSLISKINNAFNLVADPTKPDNLLNQTLATVANDPDIKDYVGLDQLMLKNFALTGNSSSTDLPFSEEFIKSYSEALASKKAKEAKTAAGSVSSDLKTGEGVDSSFNEAKRTTLGRIAYKLANSQGLNLTTNPENINDIEIIRSVLNSRIGSINDDTNIESIKLEAWRRLFTEISGTGLGSAPGKGRSYVLAGAGIDIDSISAGGTPKTIPDPAMRGANKTMYWDSPSGGPSYETIFENILQQERNVLRAQKLGADASLSADVAQQAQASLKNGMFVKMTPSPDGKGIMRTIDNQQAVLENYGDIFKYALTPSNIFSSDTARGVLIDQLKNYYENAQGKGGQLIFERDYVTKVNTALDTLKSWYSDQDSLLNTGTNLQDNIANYDKLVADRKMIEKYTSGTGATNPVVANTLLTNNQYGRLPYPDKMQDNNLYDLMLASSAPIAEAQKKANGGLIYASNGSLIDFQPKGTDTVPAMLTPGEFVVNRQSTRNNLPLLKSINKNKGGKISYYKDGGMVDGGSELDPKNSQGTKFLGKIDASTKASSGILLEILRLLNSIEQKMSNLGGGNNNATIRNWHGQNQQNMPETVSLPTAATQAPPIPAPLPVPRPPINPDMGESPEDTGPVTLGPPEMPMPEIVVPDMPDLEPIQFPEPSIPEIPMPDITPVDMEPMLPSMEDLMAPIDMPTMPPPEEGWSFDYETPFPQKVKIPEVPTPAIPSRNTPMQDVENRLGVMTPEQDQAYFDEEYRAAQDRKRERDETTNRNVAIGLRTVNDIMGPKGAIENAGNLFGGESTVEQVEGGLGLASNIASIVANLAPEDSTRGKVSGKVGAGANALKDSMETVSALMEGNYAGAAESALGVAGDVTSLLPDGALGVTGDVLGLGKDALTFGQGLMNGEIDAQSGFGAIEKAMSIGSEVGPYTTQFGAASKYLGPAGAALEVGRGSYAGVMQAQSNDPRELALAGLVGGATGDYELGGSSTAESLNKMGFNVEKGGTLDMGLEYGETLARGATSGFQAYGPAGAVGGLGVAVGGQAVKMGAAVYNDQAMAAESQAKTDQMLEQSKTNNKSMSDPTFGMDIQESSYIKNISAATAELERLKKMQEEVGSDSAVGQGIGELVSTTQNRLTNEQQGLTELASQRVNDENTTVFTLGAEDPQVKARLDEYNRRIAQSIDQLGNSMADDIDPSNLPSLASPLDASLAGAPSTTPEASLYRPNESYPIYNKTGGLIYANNGALVNFQPKGTDTIPAMLSPGEFVINKDSTQKHLGLLRAINSGEYSHGGLVSYLKNGGLLLPNYYQHGARVGPNNASMGFDISSFMNRIIGQITSSITTAFQNVTNNTQDRTAEAGGVSTSIEAGVNTIDQFVSRLDRIANTLKDLDIPSEIKIVGQHDINVVINGDSVLNQLKPELAFLVMEKVKMAFQQFKGNNSAWQDTFNFDIT